MDLIHPKNTVMIDESYDFFVEKFIPPDDILIYKVCAICKNPFQGSSKKFYELRKKCWDSFCDKCEYERKSSLKESKCVECKMSFKSSQYWFRMKRQNFPDRAMERNEFEENK